MDYEGLRLDKDDFFTHSPQSPLTLWQKRAFKGLAYFPVAPEMRMEVEVEPIKDQPEVEMQTSTGDVQTYQRFGKFHFQVDGQDAELTIYFNESGYFLPFVDSLAGQETYPAGRYLEPEVLGGGKFLIDFNMAYNPYCAYNEEWSCPLTPFENRIKLPVRAGEKLYHE